MKKRLHQYWCRRFFLFSVHVIQHLLYDMTILEMCLETKNLFNAGKKRSLSNRF